MAWCSWATADSFEPPSWHSLTYSTSLYYPSSSFWLSLPLFPGHPERKATITFHQRLSQYYSSVSSKQGRGYWSLCKRWVEIVERVLVCVCVCVVQLRAETTDRDHSVRPLQTVSQSFSEVWLPQATRHSFISIKFKPFEPVTFSLQVNPSTQPFVTESVQLVHFIKNEIFNCVIQFDLYSEVKRQALLYKQVE